MLHKKTSKTYLTLVTLLSLNEANTSTKTSAKPIQLLILALQTT